MFDLSTERVRAAPIGGPKKSPIRVCFTGRQTPGAWPIRGHQIAARRRNWYGASEIDDADIEKFDVFCFVKRPVARLMKRLHRHGKIIVFDVLDSWAQPDDGLKCLTLQGARDLFRQKWAELPPIHSYIFTNRTMQLHLAPLVRHSTYIYHHYNPAVARNPLRKSVETIGYQGNPNYLGEWREVLEEICRRKGLRFLISPEFDAGHFAEIDIGFAGRGGVHDSFLANHYKSNVKLANLYGSGTPCVVSAKEVSYHETDNGFIRFFANGRQLEHHLDSLMSQAVRQRVSDSFRVAAEDFHIERIVGLYECYFLDVARRYTARQLDRKASMPAPKGAVKPATSAPKQAKHEPGVAAKAKKPKFVPPPDDGKLRLNLGCGDKKLPGFVNVDVAPSRKGVVPDVISDLRKLDFADESVDEVLSVHVIEHFYYWEVQTVLAEWRRLLKPGGRIILECPNLLYGAQQLVNDPSLAMQGGEAWSTTMYVIYGDPGWEDPLMCHRWGWTPESLSAELERAGFVGVHEKPAVFKRGNPRDMRIVAIKPQP